MEIMLTLVNNLVKNSCVSSSKMRVIFVRLNQACIFSTSFNIRSPLYNFTKMRHAGAHFFHSDGQMDGQTRRQ